MPPKVSLLIPCYKAEPFITRLLDAAASQTFPYHEIVCYDDGSNDNALRIAERYGAKCLYGRENRGPSHARNELLANATGEFIHYHDPDDLLDGRFLEELTPFLLDDKAAFCLFKEFDGSKEVVNSYADTSTEDPVRLVVDNFLHCNSTIFPTAFVRQYARFVEDLLLYEDKCFFLTLAAHGLRFHYVDLALTTWVQRSNSLMHQHDWVQGTEMLMRFCDHALNVAPHRMDVLAPYLFRKCWMNYCADEETLPTIRKIFRRLQLAGVSSIEGLGSKSRTMSLLLPFDSVFKLRRQWAQLRRAL